MIGESMFYLEDENTDLIMGDPLETDAFYMLKDEKEEEAKGKDPSENKSPKEEGTKEEEAPAEEALGDSTEEAPVEEVSEEVVEEAPAEEVVAKESPEEAVEETPVEEESKDEAKTEESAEEEALAEEVVEKVANSKKEEPIKIEMDHEEAAYLSLQTNIYQATYSDMRKDHPKFRSGDKISVGYRVIEGERSRIQSFDGVVIKISSGHGMDKTFTVRKVSSGIGVERIFPFHSPNIDSIKVLKEGKVRRAKLYYLRNRVGKATRIKDRTSK